jgi:hypothetical protein
MEDVFGCIIELKDILLDYANWPDALDEVLVEEAFGYREANIARDWN